MHTLSKNPIEQIPRARYALRCACSVGLRELGPNEAEHHPRDGCENEVDDECLKDACAVVVSARNARVQTQMAWAWARSRKRERTLVRHGHPHLGQSRRAATHREAWPTTHSLTRTMCERRSAEGDMCARAEELGLRLRVPGRELPHGVIRDRVRLVSLPKGEASGRRSSSGRLGRVLASLGAQRAEMARQGERGAQTRRAEMIIRMAERAASAGRTTEARISRKRQARILID